MECCLQEAGWNPYYAVLLKTVLAASKAHAVTAQFCLWDHLKQLQAQPARRISNLARLAAELVVLKALPLSALRVSSLSLPVGRIFDSTNAGFNGRKDMQNWECLFHCEQQTCSKLIRPSFSISSDVQSRAFLDHLRSTTPEQRTAKPRQLAFLLCRQENLNPERSDCCLEMCRQVGRGSPAPPRSNSSGTPYLSDCCWRPRTMLAWWRS